MERLTRPKGWAIAFAASTAMWAVIIVAARAAINVVMA